MIELTLYLLQTLLIFSAVAFATATVVALFMLFGWLFVNLGKLLWLILR